MKKILLPFFPDNKWLRNHWWHRMMLVLYSFFLVFFAFLLVLEIYIYVSTDHKIHKFAYSEAIQAGYSPQEIETHLKYDPGIYPDISGMVQKGYSQTDIENDINKDLKSKQDQANKDQITTELWIAVGGFLLMVVSPFLLYRLILYIGLNGKWKDKSE